MYKALRLMHVDLFNNSSMKKSIIHIHLPKRLAMREGNHEHNFDCLRLDNWVECFRTINARTLIIVLGNKSCFVEGNGAIWVMLNAKDPFVANDIEVRLKGNQNPHSIGHESIELSYHGLMPLRRFENLRYIGWFNG